MIFARRIAVSPLALLMAACFNPGDSADADTDEATGSAGETASTTGVTATTNDVTSAPTTDDTLDSDSSGQNCENQCDELGAVCDGDTLETCAEGEDGCLETSIVRCESGCDAGACLDPFCGDGVPGDREDCDDQNDLDGDGCEDCSVTPGWECAGVPSQCVAPDLIVAVSSVDAQPGLVTVNFRVINVGELASGPFDVGVWTQEPGFDMPPEPGAVPDFLQNNLPSLAPGELVELSQGFVPPVGGDRVAFAIVDPANDVVEVDDNDNVSLGFAYTDAPNILFTSFPSSDEPVTIPDDGTPVTMSVDVNPGASAPQIFFSVNATHEQAQDLEIIAVAPGGSPQRVLFVDGERGQNLRSTTFRDGSPPLSSGAPPYLGVWSPSGNWAGGSPSNSGTYTLEIRDTMPGGADGRLNAFSVHFFEIDP